MKIQTALLAVLLFVTANVFGNKYMTKTGYAYFKSHTDAIDIDGSNRNVAAVLDASTGELVIIILIKAFDLPLATANKHFNETYMESDKFPKATFKGKVLEFSGVDLSKKGEQQVTIEGTLNIHGKDQAIKQTTKILVSPGELSGKCIFKVNIDDHGIVVPKDVKDRVAKTVDVTVDLTLKEQK